MTHESTRSLGTVHSRSQANQLPPGNVARELREIGEGTGALLGERVLPLGSKTSLRAGDA